MKTKVKIIALLLALAMALPMMVACEEATPYRPVNNSASATYQSVN